MTQCKIILLHHDPALAYSVLDQIEDSVAQRQHSIGKRYLVCQSKRKLAEFIATNSALHCDVSLIISDFVSPPLVISKSQIFCKNGIPSDVSLIFEDHFVDFNRESSIDFASKNFQQCRAFKTCFIQLFDEKEVHLLLNMDTTSNVYGFQQRLYSTAFDRSHHIQLFAKHRRASIDGWNRTKYDGLQIGEESKEENEGSFLIQMKSMDMVQNNHHGLKQRHLTSFSSMKLLNKILCTVIDGNKASPMMIMSMYKWATIRLRLKVVKEIKECTEINEGIDELLRHILRVDDKYQSQGLLRTSFV